MAERTSERSEFQFLFSPQAFVNTCKNLSNVKIAIIDHISSASAIQFPVGRIVEGLKAMQVLTLVDGAHAPGQIANLALDQLKADFYTGTLHKWCYATKGTAILWVHPKHQSWVRPLVTSHNYLKGYQEEFFMQVTIQLLGIYEHNELKTNFDPLSKLALLTFLSLA